MMFQRIARLLAVTAVFVVLGGCVAKSDYLLKQAEVDTLNGNLEALSLQNQDLLETVAELGNAIAELKTENEKISAVKNDLAVNFSTFRETTNRTIEELRHRNIELDGDRQMLMEGITLLKKSREAEVKKVSSTYEELLAEMKGEIEEGQIAITELKGKLTVDVVDKILFDSGQADVKPEGLSVLKRVVDILITATDKLIRVEGHTDNVQIGGTLAKRYPTNWELSAARALNVTR